MSNNPSINPADNGSLAGTLQFAFKKLMQSIDNMLPAKIIDYDRDENRASVEVLISRITTSNTLVARPQIDSIPVLVLGGGGVCLSFPLNTGDLGWIMANDRDISLFLQNYNQAAPNTNRVKSFSDAIFIPDVMTGYDIDDEDSENMVIQTLDGNTKISLGDDSIKLQSGNVNINVTNTGITIDNGGTEAIIEVTGGINATGIITASNIPPP